MSAGHATTPFGHHPLVPVMGSVPYMTIPYGVPRQGPYGIPRQELCWIPFAAPQFAVQPQMPFYALPPPMNIFQAMPAPPIHPPQPTSEPLGRSLVMAEKQPVGSCSSQVANHPAMGLQVTLGDTGHTRSVKLTDTEDTNLKSAVEGEEVRTVTITGPVPSRKRALSSGLDGVPEKRQRIFGVCPVSTDCGRPNHVHRHVILNHLPFFAQPETVCWGCNTQCVRKSLLRKHLEWCPKAQAFDGSALGLWVRLCGGLLQEIAKQLGVRQRNLCQLVHERGLMSTECTVSTLQAALIDWYDRSMSPGGAIDRSMDAPRSEGGLLHWRVLAGLVSACSAEGRNHIRLWSQPSGSVSKILPQGTDSHCHLREVLRRSKTSTASRRWRDNLASLTVVNVDCFPRDWGRRPLIISGVHIANAVGLHPTVVRREADKVNRAIDSVKQAINNDTVAVGEIGIDLFHEVSEEQVTMQQAALANLSAFAAKKGLPIIIHSRDRKDNRIAGTMCREVLQTSVPSSQKIQLHCYDSGMKEHQEWDKAFPETMYSISAILLSNRCHPELEQVIQEIGLDKLLLETDSPHLCPKGIRQSQHGPASICRVANRVGQLLNLPPSIVLEACSRNARTFFGL